MYGKPLQHVRIAKKPAILLVSTVIVGLCLGLLPKEWQGLSRIGHVLAMFAAGVLAAQHAAIWENAKTIERQDEKR